MSIVWMVSVSALSGMPAVQEESAKPLLVGAFVMMARSGAAVCGEGMVTEYSQPEDASDKVLKILVVEDNPTHARLIEDAFYSEGNAQLETVSTLQEAVWSLAKDSFDLIISDLFLSDGQGSTLLSESTAPIIFLTGQDDEEATVTAMKSGALDYIVKSPETIQCIPETSNRVLREWDHARQHHKIEETLRSSQRDLKLKHLELQELFRQISNGKKEWEQAMDCLQDLVVLTDNDGRVLRTNHTLRELSGKTYNQILGLRLTDVLVDFEFAFDKQNKGADIEYYHQPTGRWYLINTYPIDGISCGTGAVITGHDYTELRELNRQLEESNLTLQEKGCELEEAYYQLLMTQEKSLQQEKMATIGQLTAGVAHEINNPVGYILSNMTTLTSYLKKLKSFIVTQSELIEVNVVSEKAQGVKDLAKELKIDFVLDDLEALVGESITGADRVKKIVSDLKGFSQADQGILEESNVNELLDASINIVWNELKYKTTLNREFGEIPELLCYPRKLNQVFTNLLINAAQAIEDQGTVTIKTWVDNEYLKVSIADTGCGIRNDQLKRIFDPFYTTKEIGTGTGLGLSISYEIIKTHHGEINVESTSGVGTTFTISLPLGSEVEHDKAT